MSRLTPPVSKDDHAQGPSGAPATLVEYGDLQCPHCGEAYPVIRKLQKDFGKNLRFVFRHFPMSESHAYAYPAAIATEAAGRQHKFWEMHDVIYEHQDRLSDEGLLYFAQAIGLDMHAFRKDVKDKALAEKVAAQFESGMRSGVNGTPSFYINGYKYNGGYDYTSLKEEIEETIRQPAANR